MDRVPEDANNNPEALRIVPGEWFNPFANILDFPDTFQNPSDSDFRQKDVLLKVQDVGTITLSLATPTEHTGNPPEPRIVVGESKEETIPADGIRSWEDKNGSRLFGLMAMMNAEHQLGQRFPYALILKLPNGSLLPGKFITGSQGEPSRVAYEGWTNINKNSMPLFPEKNEILDRVQMRLVRI